MAGWIDPAAILPPMRLSGITTAGNPGSVGLPTDSGFIVPNLQYGGLNPAHPIVGLPTDSGFVVPNLQGGGQNPANPIGGSPITGSGSGGSGGGGGTPPGFTVAQSPPSAARGGSFPLGAVVAAIAVAAGGYLAYRYERSKKGGTAHE